MREPIEIAGHTYDVEVFRRREAGRGAVTIVQPSHNALELTRLAIESIRRWTTTPYELWIVDNFSEPPVRDWLLAQPDLNLIFNHTPVGGWTWRRWRGVPLPYPPLSDGWTRIPGGGSFCNGLALELAAQFAETRWMFVMHNDVLVRPGWLEYLGTKLTGRVRGVAVSSDPSRVQAMHQSGFLFDFTLFAPLRMSFLPNLPAYDAGDRVTIRLREAGYEYVVCHNTFNEPDTVAWIHDETLRRLYCDRAFNDAREVIYLHLGRGTPKTTGTYQMAGKTSAETWIRYGEGLLAQPEATCAAMEHA